MRIEPQPSQEASTGTAPSPLFTPITRRDYAAAFDHGYAKTRVFLVSRGISRETAEEVAQAAWAKGWEYRSQLRDAGRVVTWVNSIAMNLFRRIFRRENTVELPSDISTPPQVSPESIDMILTLARCSRTDRELLSKYYAEGYTSDELATQLGCTAGAIRVRLLRLRRRIQSFSEPGGRISLAAASSAAD